MCKITKLYLTNKNISKEITKINKDEINDEYKIFMSYEDMELGSKININLINLKDKSIIKTIQSTNKKYKDGAYIPSISLKDLDIGEYKLDVRIGEFNSSYVFSIIKSKKVKLMVGFLSGLSVFILTGVLIFNYNKSNVNVEIDKPTIQEGSGNVNFGEIENEEIKNKILEHTHKNTLNYEIPSEIVVDEDGKGNINLVNPKKGYADLGEGIFEFDNQVSFQATLVNKNTGEELWVSPLLKPNTNIKEFKLNGSLEKGKYEISVVFNAFKGDGEWSSTNKTDIILSVK